MATGQSLAAECTVNAAKPFLGRANDFEAREPCVAYYLRTHALNIVMAAPRDTPTKKFLIQLLDFCEKEKTRLAPKLAEVDGRFIVTSSALKLFTLADDLERQTGQASDRARNLFFTSSILFEATAQFNEGKMDPVCQDKHKYARFIASLMNKSLTSNVPYVSPNANGVASAGDGPAYDNLPNIPPPSPQQGFQQPPPPPPQSYQQPPQQQYQQPPPQQQYQQPPPQQQYQQPPPQQQYQQPPPQQQYQQPPPQQQYQQPPPQQQQQQPPPQQGYQQNAPQQPQTSETMRAPASRQDAKAKADRVVAAERCCRQAIAALQFFDENTARAQLLQAVAALDGAPSSHHH